MKYLEILDKGNEILRSNNIKNTNLDCELILSKVLNKTREQILTNLNDKIDIKSENFILNNHEIQILKKISEWPKCLDIASNKLEPHRISFYLYELVTLFHAYWNLGKDNKEFRFNSGDGKLNNSRLLLLKALAIVIKNGMSILGVSTPKIM